jgi:transcription initiation factor TFIIB
VQTSEIKTFSKNQWKKKARTGPKLNSEKANLGVKTQVGYGKNYYKYDNGAKFYRLNKINEREKSFSSERKYFVHLKRISSCLNLKESARQRAATLIRQYREEVGSTRKREVVAAAAIHIATREKDNTIPVKKIADTADLEGVKISRTYKKMLKELDIGYIEFKISDVVLRYADKLDLEKELYPKIYSCAREMDGKQVTMGKARRTIAAAVIYLVCKEYSERDISQRDVSCIMNSTTTQTFRDRINEVSEELDIEYP